MTAPGEEAGVGDAVIGLLHPGEMGAEVGKVLRGQGRTVVWASEGRGPETAHRARDAGLLDAGSVGEVARRSEILLSVCPPHAAVDVARAVAGAGFTGVFVDANAVSPGTTRQIAELVEAAGARCVDGGIVGMPPRRPGSTRLYLSGAGAGAVGELFAGTRLEAPVLGDQIGAASALKMAYAGMTKGTGALLLAVRAMARAEGVEEDLLAEWSRSMPDLPDRSRSAARAAATKGWRWVGEMEEIAAALAATGLPAGFHQAAAELYERTPRIPEAGNDEATLESVMTALAAAQIGHNVP
jgi:3-hydroxyisobutyrate dehydrogenase-like beta-hydroxyacid dehydrogenase